MEDQAQNILQPGIESLPNQLWDVVIVGAGPAGTMAAIALCRQGHEVLLLDSARFPREKVCGDGLTVEAFRHLEKVGLAETVERAGHRVENARIFSAAQHSFTIPGPFVTLRRQEFDTILAKKAVAEGVGFYHGTVRDISLNTDGNVIARFVEVAKPISARVAVLATGTRIGLAKQLGCVTKPRPSALSVRCYIRSAYDIKELVGSYYPPNSPGYGWVFPLGEQIYNVGWITFYSRYATKTNPRRAFLDFIDTHPMCQSLMASGEFMSPIRGAPLRCGLQGCSFLGNTRTLCIGELIGSTLPLTGEGISRAMETGLIAADFIHDALANGGYDSFAQFGPAMKKKFNRKYQGFRIAQDWLSRGKLSDFLAKRVIKSKYLQDSLATIVSDMNDPRSVFSFKGVLRSFWR